MKTPLRSLLALLAAALSLSLYAADATPPAAPREPDGGARKLERHMTLRHPAPGPMEREKAPFLGVETGRVTPALTAQLGLPPNVGLVVRAVVPDSPAAPVMQRHDILTKLDDQWLIETRQFAVLVRNHQPGDEVSLSYVRAGQPHTARVKLTEREVLKLARGEGEPLDHFEHLTEGPFPAGGTKHVLPLLQHSFPTETFAHAAGPGLRATALGTGTSNLVFDDEHGVLELTVREGRKSLVARNEKGEQVFSGPIDTDAERGKLPKDVKQRLDQIESLDRFRFEFGPDFEENVRFARPAPIALPILVGGHEPESAAF